MKRFIIMQGHSGSGKTTYVNDMKRHDDVVISADKYFYNDKGQYEFDITKLQESHEKAWKECINVMQDSVRNNNNDCTIWLDNTNCKKEDVDNYLIHATNNRFQIIYTIMKGEFTGKAPKYIIEEQKRNLEEFNYE
tara:strand:- start:218 stop:625 length:408 start_codon:yes stop_codon:yes gene_type:complete